MKRKTHARQAAERLARRWFREAGVPQHIIGFSDNAGYYVVIHIMARDRALTFPVPCWGARVLRGAVDLAINQYR